MFLESRPTRDAVRLEVSFHADQRYYSCARDRLLTTPNPYKVSVGGNDPASPQSWNRYTDVGNDPVNLGSDIESALNFFLSRSTVRSQGRLGGGGFQRSERERGKFVLGLLRQLSGCRRSSSILTDTILLQRRKQRECCFRLGPSLRQRWHCPLISLADW